MSESTEMLPSGVEQRAEIANEVSSRGIELIARACGVPRNALRSYLEGDDAHKRLIEHRFSPAWPEPGRGTRFAIADLPQLGEIGLRHVTARRARARGPCVALIDTLP